ncbi:MAG: type II CRISPR-associated endonuclease Cas1 [Rhodospirillales bacterium]
MAWKGVHLSRPARLAQADRQLLVRQDEGEVRLPLEDVAWIILDTPQATMTSALLAACMEEGVAIIITDARHHPSGIVLPFHRHHRQAGVAGMQIEAGTPLKKRLWQSVVRAKIENQAATLDMCGRHGARWLREMGKRVRSGDPANSEAQAARYYWGCLFEEFSRSDVADRRNSLLDYGYAIVRAAVARALVAYGLLPALGLRHASATNAFNLADDLLEPFRPFVDSLVFSLLRAAPDVADRQLSLQDRRSLAGILAATACVGEETMTLLAASEVVAASLVRGLEQKSAALLRLPRPADDDEE